MNDPEIVDLASVEAALSRAGEGHYVLRLYVSGTTPRSSTAINNIVAICDRYLKGRYSLEVVDLYQQPERALEADVLAAPTLVKETPAPTRRMVGDMSNTERVLYSLNISRPRGSSDDEP